jgi:hypothetical protein
MPYLRKASAFLGLIDPARIEHRGERPERYASDFDVVDTLRGLRQRP